MAHFLSVPSLSDEFEQNKLLFLTNGIFAARRVK